MSEADFQKRAAAALARGETDDARRLCAEARSCFPEAPWPWLREAEVLTQQRRFAEAEVVLDEAVSRFPGDFWLARARVLAVQAHVDGVEAYARSRALRLAFPDNPTAHTGFVHLLLDLKQTASAEAEAEASLALFPDFMWLRHMYARCAEQAGDTAAAASRWADLLARHPDHDPAYLSAVRALIEMGRLDEAAGIAREALRLFPDSSSARDAWAEVGHVVVAGDASLPTNEPTEDLLVDALSAERAGQWEKAARSWMLVRERLPALSQAYAGGARVLLQLGRMAEAEIVLAKARRDLPLDAYVLEAWADAAVQRGAFGQALDRFRALQAAFGTHPRAGCGIAEALHVLGRLDEAYAAFAALSAEQASDVVLAEQCALIAGERGDHAEAIQRWGQITSGFPGHLAGYWQRADALGQAERWAEADEVLSDAVARFPDDLETMLRWVTAARSPEARAARWAEAIQRFPGIGPVMQRDVHRS